MTARIRTTDWSIEYRHHPSTHKDRDMERTNARRLRRERTNRFAFRFWTVMAALLIGAASGMAAVMLLRWIGGR